MPRILFKKLHPDAVMPRYETEGAAGFDLYAIKGQPDLVIEPGEMVEVPLGFATAIEEGFFSDVRPRSGHARKGRITIQNAPGTVDDDYRGEWILLVSNEGKKPYTIPNDKAIAQGVLLKKHTAYFSFVVEYLPPSQRGDGGFGHTDDKKKS